MHAFPIHLSPFAESALTYERIPEDKEKDEITRVKKEARTKIINKKDMHY